MYPVNHSTYYKFYCIEITEKWRECYLYVQEGEVEIELPLSSTPKNWERFLQGQAITGPMSEGGDVTFRLVEGDLIYKTTNASVVISNIPLTPGIYTREPEWSATYISLLPPELSRMIFEPAIYYQGMTDHEGTLVVATPSIHVAFDVELDLQPQLRFLENYWTSSDIVRKGKKVEIMDEDAYSATFSLTISDRLYRRIEEVMPKPRKV